MMFFVGRRLGDLALESERSDMQDTVGPRRVAIWTVCDAVRVVVGLVLLTAAALNGHRVNRRDRPVDFPLVPDRLRRGRAVLRALGFRLGSIRDGRGESPCSLSVILPVSLCTTPFPEKAPATASAKSRSAPGARPRSTWQSSSSFCAGDRNVESRCPRGWSGCSRFGSWSVFLRRVATFLPRSPKTESSWGMTALWSLSRRSELGIISRCCRTSKAIPSRSSRGSCNCENDSRKASGYMKMQYPFLAGVVLATALLIVLWIATVWQFGAIRNGFWYLQGYNYVVSPTAVDMGEISLGDRCTATTTVRNLSFSPIRVVGAMATCSCLAATGLPLTIAPRQTDELKFTIVIQSPRSKVEEIANVLIDDGRLQQTPVIVTGECIAAKSGK